jgi:hypothetical protein
MQLKRFAAAIAAVVASVTLATASACGSNYNGSGLDFSFVATITNVVSYRSSNQQSNAVVTVEHLTNIKGGASSWFKRSTSYRLYTDYVGADDTYFGPHQGLIVSDILLMDGSRAKFSGRVHADARSGSPNASGFGHAADRPVIEKYTRVADKSKA